MIKVRDLHLSFDGIPVLKGVSLDIYGNEILVILGSSGQGKTVLIKSIVGLIKPDSGTILFDDENIFQMSKRRFRDVKKKIAFVFQDNALFDFLSVRENLSLYLRMHTKLGGNEIEKRIERAMDFVQLEKETLDRYPEELSGGMEKRVALARAIIKEPCYFFYDEPTVGLDEGNVDKVIELILKLKPRVCTTAVIVTHDIHLMRSVADRVIFLKDGDVRFTGPPDKISKDILHDLYEVGVGHEYK